MKQHPDAKTWRLKTVAITATLSVAATIAVAGLSLAPAAEAVAVADSYGEGDGLNRYVVTLTGDPAAPASSPDATGPSAPVDVEPAPQAPAVSKAEKTSADDVVRGRLDVAMLARAQQELGLDGRVASNDGIAYYVTQSAAMVVSPGADGAVLPSSAAGMPAAAAPAAEPAAPEALVAPVSADSDAVLEALAASPGVVSAQRLPDGQVLISTTLDLRSVAELAQVADVQESVQVPVAGSASDPMYVPYGWNLKNTGSNAYQQSAKAGADINAPDGWDVTQGQGTVVAVIDTGFDSDHPDLVGSLWTSPTESCGNADTNGNGKVGDCHGWNFYTNSADVDNGAFGSHGTTVAGSLAARIDNGQGSAGVAPKTSIMPLVVGGGENVDINLAIAAIRYAVDNGADVINASFGGTFAGTTLTAMSAAVDYATAHGVPVVAAAGNDAGNRDSSAIYPASLANAGVITVGSTTAMDTAATTSAYGAKSVDLHAPGELVFTTWNDGGYRLVSGTSIAAPHVAAAMALYRSVNPDASVAELKAAVMADSTKLASLNGKSVSAGRLNIGALKGAGSGANESVGYEFSSMVAHPGAQQPVVKVTTTASAGSYTVRLGLAMLVDGEVWAVSGEDITVGGSTVMTDDTGTATFPLGDLAFLGTKSLSPALTLGEGKFALTAQVLKGGQPMTRPYAAPLIVDSSATLPDPGEVTPGTPAPGPTDGSGPGTGTNPGTGTGTDPGTGTTPGTTNPGTGTDPGSNPGTPGTGTNPGTGGGTTDPGTTGPDPAGPGAGTTPVNPGTTDPGGAGPGTPSPAPGTTDPAPGTTTPGTTTPDPGTSDPSVPDFKTFDNVGAFKLTRISPVHVPAAGGTLVEIRGLALEDGVGVRVAAMSTADVVIATSTHVKFRSPAMVPGTYDVTVYKNGRTSVLPDALVVGGGGASVPGPSDPGGSNPGSGGQSPTPAPGTTPPPGTTPGPGKTPTPTPTAPGGGGGPVTTPTAPNATRVGPNGERLVRNDSLVAMSGLWGTTCTGTCAGQQV